MHITKKSLCIPPALQERIQRYLLARDATDKVHSTGYLAAFTVRGRQKRLL